ncbi:MAG: hypothetical protein IKD37_04815 [Clostridia bacterium]|nr:hypothetical protein [Clostridia bacterium]
MMIKRSLLLAALLMLAAALLLGACSTHTDPGPDSTETTPQETEPPVREDRLSDKYDVDVNSILTVPGTFTDRMTAEQFSEAMTRGQSMQADPLLYNLIQIMELTRDDITLYSEMIGGALDSVLIDSLFLEGAAMREALRGDYTIMAGGYPYTVYELAFMSEDDRKALNIAPADLSAFLASIPAAAQSIGEPLDADIQAFLEANTAK